MHKKYIEMQKHAFTNRNSVKTWKKESHNMYTNDLQEKNNVLKERIWWRCPTYAECTKVSHSLHNVGLWVSFPFSDGGARH